MSNKKKTFILLFILIFSLGIFLRAYNFSDWLHFELDQSRDARIIYSAVENGISNLTLLGPRAGGTFLRLGPAFYYFEYLSAIFFGNTPSGMAVFNLLFSIGAIAVFYFFVREYFTKKISLALMAVFSTSLYLVMYSRFAWNPNSLVFFELLSFYSLLKILNQEEKRKGVWLFVLAISLAVATQLHFLALLSLPFICLVFILIKRPKISWRAWAAAILAIFFLYSPMILNEIKTGGANVKELPGAISGKSNKEKHSIIASAIRNYQENSIANWLVISGSEKGESLKIERPLKPALICDQGCRSNLPYTAVGLIIFTGGILFLLKNIFKEKEPIKKNFLLVVAGWLAIVFAMYVPLAYDLSPRFFLLTAPIYLIFLGFWFQMFSKFLKGWPIIILALILVATNLFFAQKRFNELKLAPTQDVKIKADRILKERTRVTLLQQKLISQFIESKYKKNNFPVYIKSEPQYDRAFKYLSENKIPTRDFGTERAYRMGNYFLIWRTSSNIESKNEKYLNALDIVEKKQFGTLTVFYLSPKSDLVDDSPEEIKNEEESSSSVPKRYTWKEFFSSEAGSEEGDNAEEESLLQEEGI